MIFHQIDVQGSNWLQRLSTTPAPSAAVEGRFAFIEDIDTFSFKDSSDWVPYYTFQSISISGGSTVYVTSPETALNLVSSGGGIVITTTPASKKINLAGSFSLGTIAVSGQGDIVADLIGDTITLEPSAGITITTTSATKTISFAGYPFWNNFTVGGSSISATVPADEFKLASSVLAFASTPSSKSISISFGYSDGFFSSGRKIWANQLTAPTGWSVVTNTTGAMIAVKSASGDYNVTGGNTAGSWTHPTHVHSGNSHSHTSVGHTHTFDNDEQYCTCDQTCYSYAGCTCDNY